MAISSFPDIIWLVIHVRDTPEDSVKLRLMYRRHYTDTVLAALRKDYIGIYTHSRGHCRLRMKEPGYTYIEKTQAANPDMAPNYAEHLRRQGIVPPDEIATWNKGMKS